jgi:hypothetical protein
MQKNRLKEISGVGVREEREGETDAFNVRENNERENALLWPKDRVPSMREREHCAVTKG